MLKKSVREFHGKKLFLLGKSEDGTFYYLESPSWDCGWYWGFGYIEGFAKETPTDRGHDSHEHAEDFLSKWFTEHNGSKPRLVETVFDEAGGWKLSELFASFYILKDAAGLFGRGGSHVAENPAKLALVSVEMTQRINEVMIPAVTEEIIKILTV